jgi:hypothetical protein
MERMEKQTAVEQFIDQLEQQGECWENVSMGTINISIKVDDYLKLKDKAKEMFKQEVLRSHMHNRCLQDQTYECSMKAFDNAEKYYKDIFETYKSE